MAKPFPRIVKALAAALAAGAVVAMGNPVQPIDHDVSTAVRDVTQLAKVTTAAAAGITLAPTSRV
jgi:hypothetical protein